MSSSHLVLSKDIVLELPVVIMHPAAMPALPPPPIIDPYAIPRYHRQASPTRALPVPPAVSPYQYASPPLSPLTPVPLDHNPHYIPYDHQQQQMWIPTHAPAPYQYFSPPLAGQQYHFPAPAPAPVTALNLPYLPVMAPVVLEQPQTSAPEQGEEGKGEVASRVAHHLRLTSQERRRGRSVSPVSHRYPLPVPPTQSQPIVEDEAPGVPHSMIDPRPRRASMSVDIPPPGAVSEGIILSPRPRLSPRLSKARLADIDRLSHTPAGDVAAPTLSPPPMTSDSGAEVAQAPNLLQETAYFDSKPVEINKTLPSPPVPTRKINGVETSGDKPRVDRIFSEAEPPSTSSVPAVNGRLTAAGGLDALERRLLLDVGTRKPQQPPRIDVRSLLPTSAEEVEPSLLVDPPVVIHERKRPTRIAKSPSPAAIPATPKEAETAPTKPATASSAEHNRGQLRDRRPRPPVVEADPKNKQAEALRIRKAAKGRVAAWLGNVDDVVEKPLDTFTPVSDPPSKSDQPKGADSETKHRGAREATVRRASPSRKTPVSANPPIEVSELQAEVVTSVPNRRSSGFMPIGSMIQNDAGTRWSTMRKQKVNTANPPAQHQAPVPNQEPKATGPVSNAWTDLLSSPKRSEPKISAPPPARITKIQFPPPVVPNLESKYDIRSARGGKGGRVTAVTSIWASQIAEGSGDTEKVSKPAPKPTVGKHDREPAVSPPKAPQTAKAKQHAQRSAPQNRTDIPGNPADRNEKKIKSLSIPTVSPMDQDSKEQTLHPARAPLPKEPAMGDLTARTAAFIKSPSSPAVISTSFATPMLSTTASLARPTPKPGIGVKRPPIVSNNLPETIAPSTSNAPAPVKDLAFGQARLRDLIKKYQE